MKPKEYGLLTIYNMEKLNCTVNWNPRYKITGELNGSYIEMHTASDAMYVYWIKNYIVDDKIMVYFHETKTKYIIDWVSKPNEVQLEKFI